MKKLILASVFALGTLTAVNAQVTETVQEVQNEPTALNVTPTNSATLQAAMDQDFKEVSIEEVPEVVIQAVDTDFEGAVVTKVFKNDNDEFQLVLQSDDETIQTVYANKDGDWIKKGGK